MKCSRKMLQNLSYLIYIKNLKLLFPFFISCYFISIPNECPGLCWHRLGHSLGKNLKLHEMKTKKLRGFSYTLSWAQNSHFWRVTVNLLFHISMIDRQSLQIAFVFTYQPPSDENVLFFKNAFWIIIQFKKCRCTMKCYWVAEKP